MIPVASRQVFLKTALESADNVRMVEEEASAVVGRPLTVSIVAEAPPSNDQGGAGGAGDNDSTGQRRERLIEEAMKEPVVKTVMDMFKGRIVDIREAR